MSSIAFKRQTITTYTVSKSSSYSYSSTFIQEPTHYTVDIDTINNIGNQFEKKINYGTTLYDLILSIQ